MRLASVPNEVHNELAGHETGDVADSYGGLRAPPERRETYSSPASSLALIEPIAAAIASLLYSLAALVWAIRRRP